MFSRIKSYINHLIWTTGLVQIQDIVLEQHLKSLTEASPNRFNLYGSSFFSQNDEDGLLREILKRIGVSQGSFLEFGVGNGLENNTLLLALKGWQGKWYGGQKLSLDIQNVPNLSFFNCWIDKESLKEEVIPVIKSTTFDVISLDLDGNDYHFCELLLENGILPKVWIQEYNSTFPSDMNWVMPYSSRHKWSSTNLYGASFSSFIDLFKMHGYAPVVCSITGANIFFVRNCDINKFPEVPSDSNLIYLPSRPYLLKGRRKIDPKVLRGFTQTKNESISPGFEELR